MAELVSSLFIAGSVLSIIIGGIIQYNALNSSLKAPSKDVLVTMWFVGFFSLLLSQVLSGHLRAIIYCFPTAILAGLAGYCWGWKNGKSGRSFIVLTFLLFPWLVVERELQFVFMMLSPIFAHQAMMWGVAKQHRVFLQKIKKLWGGNKPNNTPPKAGR